MQEKIGDIERIQSVLWRAYKDFLDDRDQNRYKARADALVCTSVGNVQLFCSSLVIAWAPMIEELSWNFKNRINTKKKEICIKHIQNTLWASYQSFLEDHDMGGYNRRMERLAKEYCAKGDRQLLVFCQWLLIAWCPIINGFAGEFRNGIN